MAKPHVDWPMVDRLFKCGSEIADVATRCGLTLSQLNEAIIKQKKMKPFEYRKLQLGAGNSMLLEAQFNEAMKGNPAVLIFLGKNRLNQRDRMDHHVDVFSNFVNKEGESIPSDELDNWEEQELGAANS